MQYVLDLHISRSETPSPWSLRVLEQNQLFLPVSVDADISESAPDITNTIHNLSLSNQSDQQPDWRFSSISITPIDMDTASTPLKSRYLGHGVIRLYRVDSSLPIAAADGDNHPQAHVSETDQASGTVLAILAVPSYLSPTDLVGFVGSHYASHISHFRMVSSEASNRYMVLIKFRSQNWAQQFQTEYNGKLFNSMEAESCHVLFIREIIFGSEITQSDDFPYLIEDEFTSRPRAGSFNKPLPPPPQSLRELPTCPVCLERMDNNVTGLLTILCQHTFHCQCLSKWADGSCPVCRYSQLPRVPTGDSRCSICKTERNLWICLICGQIGCGRYDQGHAVDHYNQTGHCYAMDIATQRVWDYSGDNYVHRLLQNESDGKLVETGSSADIGSSDVGTSSLEAGGSNHDKKHKTSNTEDEEELAIQYTRLLSSQLESQRVYYEDMLLSAADNTSGANERCIQAEKKLEELTKQIEENKEKVTESHRLKQELDSQKQKNEKLTNLCRILEKKFREEEQLSKQMMTKLDKLEGKDKDKDMEIKDLKDQVRDLMFFLEARDTLGNEGEDVREGTVTVGKKGRRR